MSEVLKELPFVRVYLDDVVIFSKTQEEHVDHILQVVERVPAHRLKVKVNKCSFAQTGVELLGHIIDRNGFRVDPKKVKEIQGTPPHTIVMKLRSFLGIAGYYRRFIRSFVAC